MGQVSDSGGDSDSLIDLSVYYDEYGNMVSESGYLLDEDGNLVVCNDAGITATYSVTDNHGVTWIVGEDAAIVDTMIRSVIDSDAGTTHIDQYGNEVTADGLLVDQSDPGGGALIVSSGELSIQEQVVTEVAAGDGSTYTFADGDTATFTDTGTTAGNVYVQVSEVSETHYDAYGSQLTSSDTSAVLADSDGNVLSVTAAHVSAGYVYNDGTHEYATQSTCASGSYYVVAWEGVTQFYVGETQLQAADSVYVDSDAACHLLGAAISGSYAASGTIIDHVATQTQITATEATAGDSDATYFLALNSDTAYTLTYYISSQFTWPSAVTDSDVDAGWYTVVTPTGASHWTALDVTTAAVHGYVYYYDGATLYTYQATAVNGISYTGSSLPLDVVLKTASLYAASASSACLILDSGSLSDDGAASVTAASTVSLAANAVYAGWQLAYDDAGNWVSMQSGEDDTWYLAASADASGTTLILRGASELSGAYYYTQHGHAYYTTASTTDDSGVTYYYDFIADYSHSEYVSVIGSLSVDEEGYILDESEEDKQVFTAAAVFDYVQEVTAEDGTTRRYYYYFGSGTAADYISQVDPRDASQGYYVATGVNTTIYYDSYGNPLNAAGCIINPDTGNIITTSQTTVQTGYAFTSLNGITYTVSGEAYIEEADGTHIVYSGVSEIRYYSDDNGSGQADEGDTEYTADELWIIIRSELDEIACYQSVATGEIITAAQYRSGDYAT